MEKAQDPRLAIHEEIVTYLDGLAVLVGCQVSLGNRLPDGSRPDVARCDPQRGILFLGDAKNTESPGCQVTRERLLTYLVWLERHISCGGRAGHFALCFLSWEHRDGWKSCLEVLAHKAGLGVTTAKMADLGPGIYVTWISLEREAERPLM